MWRFCREGCTGTSTKATKSCKKHGLKAVWNSRPDPADSPDSPDLGHGVQLGTSLPHAPKGQDYVSFIKLPQITWQLHMYFPNMKDLATLDEKPLDG